MSTQVVTQRQTFHDLHWSKSACPASSAGSTTQPRIILTHAPSAATIRPRLRTALPFEPRTEVRGGVDNE